jgi:hypothetical protein
MPSANTILRPDSTIVPESRYANRMDSATVYTSIRLTRADIYHTDVRLVADSSSVSSTEHRLTADRTIVSEAPVGPQRRMPRYRIL